MPHKLPLLLATVAIAAMLPGCAEKPAPNRAAATVLPGGTVTQASGRPSLGKRDGKPDERVVAGANAFALRLFQELDGEGRGNTLVSPFSTSAALAMTYNGSSRQTANEIAKVLRVDGLPLDVVNRSYADAIATVEVTPTPMMRRYPDAPITEIDVANSMWGQDGLRFEQPFIETLDEYYDADVRQVDFDDPRTPEQIDEWIAEQSRGLLHFNTAPPGPLVLVSTLYFRSTWAYQFPSRATTDAPFYLLPKLTAPVRMMRLDADTEVQKLRYAETAEAQAIRLPYVGDGMAMYVFLPTPGRDLSTILRSLDEKTWPKWRASMEERPGVLQLPRFDVGQHQSLEPALQRLGMRRAFSASADFDRTFVGRPLGIDDVLHDVRIKVDETGTVAAAENAVCYYSGDNEQDMNRPYRMTVDRPFAFFIVDERSGLILFTGAVRDPR